MEAIQEIFLVDDFMLGMGEVSASKNYYVYKAPQESC